MKRPTIADIAKAAGVSKGAVSYALNGRPGVAESTRERILEIARSLGWAPSSAARALSDGRAGAIGLIVDRPARVLAAEPYFMQLIAGIETALADGPFALLLQVTDDPEAELATYRRWWAERRVDGVLIVDLRIGDPRVPLLAELGLPAVVLGRPEDGDRLPCVWTDDGAAMTEVLHYLAALNHRDVVRVAGPAGFVHTRTRTAAFDAAAAALDLNARTVHTDYSDEEAAVAVRRVLTAARRPTAMVFDNDVMAIAALGVAQELGLSVPGQLSIVAWDDSALCRLVRPALTAVSRPIPKHGEEAVRLLLSVLAGEAAADVRTTQPVLVPRASTAVRH
ncbi:DNA-binding LacI/PurR family transcriptional regulator [Amycolatopsis bartoniae]|uniref:LacI family transcriptional regulator n=1 Tax=Amycolatopsis bartoniae TaxID=941986 RepID=A0A8H9MB13_9PSEU|nr:LacI family DNA-binding transcriptional regulator [Amycolatopsis bartoniae]MBB2937848.1 DNA-binding LacI/PurR family transcriptional regulator [Amycolatopsis bartoniae]TVT01338.1 LacI family transcriptional regulator [Amycolatopsis bartoniae]GHF41183.1 LacI family transcriptional regulator [Amycolatopsis bartoniae]